MKNLLKIWLLAMCILFSVSLTACEISFACMHTYSEWETVSPASCTTPGYQTRTCTKCGDFDERTLNPTGHTREFVSAIYQNETYCSVVYRCAVCFASETVLEWHQPNDFGICEHCGRTIAGKDSESQSQSESESKEPETPETPCSHSYVKTSERAATCTAAGSITYTCRLCSDVKTDEVPALGHSISKVSAVSATCTKTGNIEYYHCNRCGNNYRDNVGAIAVTNVTTAKTAHSLSYVAGKAATATAAGNIPYYICKNCSAKFKDEAGKNPVTGDVTIPATGEQPQQSVYVLKPGDVGLSSTTSGGLFTETTTTAATIVVRKDTCGESNGGYGSTPIFGGSGYTHYLTAKFTVSEAGFYQLDLEMTKTYMHWVCVYNETTESLAAGRIYAMDGKNPSQQTSTDLSSYKVPKTGAYETPLAVVYMQKGENVVKIGFANHGSSSYAVGISSISANLLVADYQDTLYMKKGGFLRKDVGHAGNIMNFMELGAHTLEEGDYHIYALVCTANVKAGDYYALVPTGKALNASLCESYKIKGSVQTFTHSALVSDPNNKTTINTYGSGVLQDWGTVTIETAGDYYFAGNTVTTGGVMGFTAILVVTEEDAPGVCRHKYGEWQTGVTPTCEKDGTEVRTCTKCSATETRTLPTKGHVYEVESASYVSATVCAVTYRCEVCKTKTKTENTAHDAGNWTVATPATEDEEGLRVRTCKNCKETVATAVIPKAGDVLAVQENYRIVFLADIHLYDQEGMYYMSSAERAEMAIQAALLEHKKDPIGLVVFTGDNVNNYRYSYKAGTFESWDSFTYNGVTYTSKYKGVKYPAGESGTKNDPLGVLRILSFLELLKPLDDAGIRCIFANGNHDCYRDEIFEMAYKMNHVTGYIEAEKHYETDSSGNLLVKDYEIKDNTFAFVDRKIAPTDKEYEFYAKGYGQNYTFAYDYDTAFAVVDAYHCEGALDTKTGKWEESGFVTNASGRSWPAVELQTSLLSSMMNKVKGYKDVYFVLHCAGGETVSKQGALYTAMKNNSNVVCVFDGHTHMETAEKNVGSTGKYRFTCGYFGIPMYERQKLFKQEPFSYRVLEKDGGKLSTYIALVEHDYAAYTFSQSSGASIPAFYQPFTTRGLVTIRDQE